MQRRPRPWLHNVQLDIFEPDLFVVEIDRRTETLNRFAIDGAIAQQNLSLPDGAARVPATCIWTSTVPVTG